MSPHLQSILALLIVAAAIFLLARSALKKRKNPGCGGECGCPTDTFKTNLKRQPKSSEERVDGTRTSNRVEQKETVNEGG